MAAGAAVSQTRLSPSPFWKVVVGEDEPQDNAMKRFRREVMVANVIPEVRGRPADAGAAEAKNAALLLLLW